MRNKTGVATARHFDQQCDAFSCFLRRRLYISLREFKIEKEKRVLRDRLELASPERNSQVGRTNNFLATQLFLSLLLCLVIVFVTGDQEKKATILQFDTANTRSLVNDNIFQFLFLWLLVFFVFFLKLFFGLFHFRNSLSLLCSLLCIFLFIYLSFSRKFTKLSIAIDDSMSFRKIRTSYFFARIRTLISNCQKSKFIIGFYSRLFLNQTLASRVLAKLKPKRCTRGVLLRLPEFQ